MTLFDEEETLKLHSKIYIGNLLIKMYYPNVITFLVEKVGADEARTRLFQIGQAVGRKLLKLRDLKTTDPEKLIYRFYKVMWNTTKHVKVQKKKEKARTIYRVVDKNCGVCDPETAIEGLNVPCVSIDGYLDACMEHLLNLGAIKSYKIETTASIATGDPICVHEIEVLR